MPAPSDKQAPRKPGRAYARYIISRAKELKDSSAFEPPSLTGQALDYAQVEADLRASRRRARRWICAMLVAIVVLAIGIAFTLAHPLWLRNVYKRFMKRRYVNMEGFRASRHA